MDKALAKLYRVKATELLTIYRATIRIPEDYDERTIRDFGDEVTNFVKDQKDLLATLTSFKKQLKSIVPIQEETNSYYKSFAGFLEKYEESRDKISAGHGGNALSHVKLISGAKGN